MDDFGPSDLGPKATTKVLQDNDLVSRVNAALLVDRMTRNETGDQKRLLRDAAFSHSNAAW